MNAETRLAYLAGFFDGEGCVYILRRRAKTTVGYDLEASFSNSKLPPLLLAQETFGGTMTSCKDVRAGKKQVYRLRLRSGQAVAALRSLLPFLLVKEKQAELAIEFMSLKAGPRIEGSKRSISVEDCERYKAEITVMNDKVWNRGKVLA